VTADSSLAERTAELTRDLGRADGHAMPTLIAWVREGVYDDLLSGLGDGMAAGLVVGIGESGTDTVVRRAASAAVLGECVARDTHGSLVAAGKVVDWADRLAAWLIRERDLRALPAGAHALAAVAASPHVGRPELAVLLDVLADRALGGEPLGVPGADALAEVALAVLRRGLVPQGVVERWVARLRDGAASPAGAAQLVLRSLHLHVELTSRQPPGRADLLLVLVDALRATNAALRS
jgi:hypothetical protein